MYLWLAIDKTMPKGELIGNYKHHATLKGLVGIIGGRAVILISQLYTGSISGRGSESEKWLPFQDNNAAKSFTLKIWFPWEFP